MYSDRFDKFTGKYHIVLKTNRNPVIYVPSKCPLSLKDEIKAELEDMVTNGFIWKIDELTDWVKSIVFVSKCSGKLRICLNPKDLNKAIKRCHYMTPTLEEVSHKLENAKQFAKMNAKNGYWSIKLDADFQSLTPFNSSFGRYCFRRTTFGLVMSHDVFQQNINNIRAISEDNRTNKWCSGLWTNEGGAWSKPSQLREGCQMRTFIFK